MHFYELVAQCRDVVRSVSTASIHQFTGSPIKQYAYVRRISEKEGKCL